MRQLKILTLILNDNTSITIDVAKVNVGSINSMTANDATNKDFPCSTIHFSPLKNITDKYDRVKPAKDEKVVEITKKQHDTTFPFNLMISELSSYVVKIVLSTIKKLRDSPTIHELTIDVKEINETINQFCDEIPFILMQDQKEISKENEKKE